MIDKKQLRRELAQWAHTLDQETETVRATVRADLAEFCDGEATTTTELMTRLGNPPAGVNGDAVYRLLVSLAIMKLGEFISEWGQEIVDQDTDVSMR